MKQSLYSFKNLDEKLPVQHLFYEAESENNRDTSKYVRACHISPSLTQYSAESTFNQQKSNFSHIAYQKHC